MHAFLLKAGLSTIHVGGGISPCRTRPIQMFLARREHSPRDNYALCADL